MMKHIALATVLAATIALGASSTGSPTAEEAPQKAALTAAAKAPAPPAGHNSSTFTGTVGQYLLSPRGEVEGLLLKDGTSVRLTTGAAGILVSQVKPGDKITVTAAAPVPPSSPQGRGVRATSVTVEKSNRTITDQPPSNAPAAATPNSAGRHMEVRGHIVRVIRNADGQADGVLLTGGQQVRMPPEIGNELVRLNESSPGGDVRASGMGVKTDYGTVIDALSLRYQGQSLSSKETPPSPPAIPGRR